MALPVQILAKEDVASLRKYRKKTPAHLHPRIKMLLGILQGIHKNNELAAHTGSGLRSIIRWKFLYQQGGIDLLLEEKRGGDMRSQFNEQSHARLAKKLSNPIDAFTSYHEARAWIKKELGIELSYMATWLYLRRNFGTKLKVGRKSHIKKDETAPFTIANNFIFQKNTPAFLPPYSPELNPAEKIWRPIKDKIANQIFETLKDISDALAHIVSPPNALLQ